MIVLSCVLSATNGVCDDVFFGFTITHMYIGFLMLFTDGISKGFSFKKDFYSKKVPTLIEEWETNNHPLNSETSNTSSSIISSSWLFHISVLYPPEN